MHIRELVARRSDLGTFVVHLTRAGEGDDTARNRLDHILQSGRLEARTAYGQAVSLIAGDAAALESQRVVCFTETPLEYLHLLVQPIEGRQVQFAPYGVGITKRVARRSGVNPVWYLDMTPGHDFLTEPLNRLVRAAIGRGDFVDSDVAKLAPFVEQMGTHPDGRYRKEFWWEREWRAVGDVALANRFIGFCPETDMLALQQIAADFGRNVVWLDPAWGLEEIIGKLAGFAPRDIGSPV